MAEQTVQGALEASTREELTAFLDEHRVELLQDLPGLVDRARTSVLSGDRETEHIGRVLVALGAHSTEGLGAGHFLIGYALRFGGKDGRRQFEQARLAYGDLGSRTLECLSGLAAEASRTDPQALDTSVAGLTAAFDRLAAADTDCARRLKPGIDRFVTVLRVTRELVESTALPAGLPGATDDEVNTLRSAMVTAIRQPERIAPIARWIQAQRGLPAGSTEELDAMAAMLGDVRSWEPRIRLLRDMIAHGDRRSETLIQLADSLVETGNWSEARALVTARIGDRPGPQHLELVQFLVMCSMRASDPDAAAWAATLRALGGELPESAMPPPSQLRETAQEAPAPSPRLSAHYEDGTLTIDPGGAGPGPAGLDAHLRAAMVTGLGPEKGAEFLADIAAKEPDLYPQVVALLPPHLRPLPVAEQHLARAEEHFRNSRYREAVPEYLKAIEADPELEYAHLGLGDAYYMLGDFHLAVAHFTESIAIRPTPQAYRFLGDAVLRSDGDRRRAKHCYEQALALDPDYGGARDALARLTGDSRGGPARGR